MLTDLHSWRYIKSNDMIADLGTRKGARILDITQNSEWVNGKAWMSLNESEFPVSTVSKITLNCTERSKASSECNKLDITGQICIINSQNYAQSGSFISASVPDQVKTRYEFLQYIIDPNKFRLCKIICIISLVYLFVKNCYSACGLKGKFNKHPKVTIDPIPIPFSCEGEQYIVTTDSLGNGNPFRCPGGLVICVSNNEVRLAMTYLFRKATMDVKEFLNVQVYNSISNEINGILYYTGRILPSMMERIRLQMSDSMFDLSRISFCVPITEKHSPFAYAIISKVHNHHPDVKHSSVETTLRHVELIAHVIGGRELVKKYGKNYAKCRILNKNVVKVLMGPLHEGQLKIAPAFLRHRLTFLDHLIHMILLTNGKVSKFGLSSFVV